MTTRITNASYVCSDGKTIKVITPNRILWFWTRDLMSSFVMRDEDGEVHSVSKSRVEAIANHDSNEYETVPYEDSPFKDDA